MKTIYSVIILVVIFIPLFFGFLCLDTWSHEKGHVDTAKKQGINFHISKLNFIPDFSNPNDWGKGAAIPNSENDCVKFNSLPRIKQQVISHAGVIREMLIFVPLFLISLGTLFIYGKYILENNIVFFVLLCLLLISFEIIILSSVYGNIFLHFVRNTSNPTDWYAGNFTSCSIYG